MRTERESTVMYPALRAANGVALCVLVILLFFLGASLVAGGPKQPEPGLVLWSLSLLLGVWAGSAVYFHLALRCLDGAQPGEGVQAEAPSCCPPAAVVPTPQ